VSSAKAAAYFALSATANLMGRKSSLGCKDRLRSALCINQDALHNLLPVRLPPAGPHIKSHYKTDGAYAPDSCTLLDSRRRSAVFLRRDALITSSATHRV